MTLYLNSMICLSLLLVFTYKLISRQDGFFNELIVWGYKVIFAPLIFSITNYFLVIRFNISKNFFLFSILIFFPLIVMWVKHALREYNDNKGENLLRKNSTPIIKKFFLEAGIIIEETDISFRSSYHGGNQKDAIIINMPEKTEEYEELRIRLEPELREKNRRPGLMLIFNYQFVYKKKK